MCLWFAVAGLRWPAGIDLGLLHVAELLCLTLIWNSLNVDFTLQEVHGAMVMDQTARFPVHHFLAD